eukprot:TRINITY_DN26756_c0_g1_i1.p1 TRINITY_DN26756_c0_g1~~TRINITY_DN26756_c0_g1_i1.p1  ORF type:complete len:116 (+),score=9.76 TRINITY_DN26756_c0_g1_i1:53-349(+)
MARVRVLIPFVLLLILSSVSHSSPSREFNRNMEISGWNRHSLSFSKKNIDGNQATNCRDIGSRSQCSKISKCRWCRSDAIDDMCFSSSEAWRLPQQTM